MGEQACVCCRAKKMKALQKFDSYGFLHLAVVLHAESDCFLRWPSCHSNRAGLSHRAPALRQTGLCSEARAPVRFGLCPPIA
jgi:hypothetical protein